MPLPLLLAPLPNAASTRSGRRFIPHTHKQIIQVNLTTADPVPVAPGAKLEFRCVWAPTGTCLAAGLSEGWPMGRLAQRAVDSAGARLMQALSGR